MNRRGFFASLAAGFAAAAGAAVAVALPAPKPKAPGINPRTVPQWRNYCAGSYRPLTNREVAELIRNRFSIMGTKTPHGLDLWIAKP